MKFLAVIPAHNEANAVAQVVRGVAAAGLDALVVDDGSVDATADLARAEGATVISTGTKGGKGNALILGFDLAIRKGYDGVIALDGDGQHQPSDVPLFLAAARAGADLVNGNRMNNPEGMPGLRRITNRFMSRMISWICHQHIPDTQCGFRLIKSPVLRSITLECRDFEIETEILVKASRAGYRIVSVPIASIYRDEKSKIRPWRDTLRFIRYIAGALTKP